jgi:integrase
VVYLKEIIVTFNQVMNYATRHRYIDHNPVRDAERPRDQGNETKSEIRILKPREINAFLSAEKDPEYRTLFMLTIMSGARQGELLGLKWPDVDWANNQVHIQRTYNEGAWYNPKSAKSIRKIDLGLTMMTELKKWKLACPPNDLDLVFPNEAGNPINHSNMLSRHFFPAMKEAGVGKIRFHDLRHTYASLLLEQGENIKYIQTQLGHASPVVTLNVYAHLMNAVNQESPSRLENAVFGNFGSRMVAEKNKGAAV